MNLKESEKKDKYQDLARELKKPWNMKLTFIPVVISPVILKEKKKININKTHSNKQPNSNPEDNLECPRGVMVKAMDWGVIVSEFELQSRHYVHFRANTLPKGMNPLILPWVK